MRSRDLQIWACIATLIDQWQWPKLINHWFIRKLRVSERLPKFHMWVISELTKQKKASTKSVSYIMTLN